VRRDIVAALSSVARESEKEREFERVFDVDSVESAEAVRNG
jgi:hypothetical protein